MIATNICVSQIFDSHHILSLRYRKAYVHKVNRYIFMIAYMYTTLIKRELKDRKYIYSCEIFPSPLKSLATFRYIYIYIFAENKGNCI